MRTFAEVVNAFGGPARFAEAIGIPAFHAQTMKTRDSIPATYWSDVVEAAKQARIKGISLELLAEIAAEKRPAARAAS